MRIELPTPTPEHIKRFKDIIQKTRGITLSDTEADNQCRQFIQFIYYRDYAVPTLQRMKAEQAARMQNPPPEEQSSYSEEMLSE